MENVILVIHVLAAASVIGLVLLQHGKGADMGAAFGSGASGSLFGVSGSSNLLSKLTSIFITVFFATSLTLAYLSSHKAGSGSVVKSPLTQQAPAKGDVVEPAKPVENTPKDIPN
jgi:preprotein translocase subunit SecG